MIASVKGLHALPISEPVPPRDRVQTIEKAVRDILIAVGEDVDREGLKDTPARVARMYLEIFSGLHADPGQFLASVFQEEVHDGTVIVRDIPFHSMCEHHLLPFFGKASVAILPKDGRLPGLSSVASVVQTLARRPQMQERLNDQIVETICERLGPRGAFAILEAEHLCVTMRGARVTGSTTLTTAARGVFQDDPAARAEILALLRR